jgi:hypothetical protein
MNKIVLALLLTAAACEPCRQDGATYADEPGTVAVYCFDGAADCWCVE